MCPASRRERTAQKTALDSSGGSLRNPTRRIISSPPGALVGNSSQPMKDGSVTAAQPAVTNASEPAAKIALLRELFRGREDVYPIHWIGRDGRSGYSPAAIREETGDFKNSSYKNRKCFPLTNAVIRDYLLGRQTVGIYPLLLDESCWFLALISINNDGKQTSRPS